MISAYITQFSQSVIRRFHYIQYIVIIWANFIFNLTYFMIIWLFNFTKIFRYILLFNIIDGIPQIYLSLVILMDWTIEIIILFTIFVCLIKIDYIFLIIITSHQIKTIILLISWSKCFLYKLIISLPIGIINNWWQNIRFI